MGAKSGVGRTFFVVLPGDFEQEETEETEGKKDIFNRLKSGERDDHLSDSEDNETATRDNDIATPMLLSAVII